MPQSKSACSSAVLFGLPDFLAAELKKALTERRLAVHTHPFVSGPDCLSLARNVDADLVFCAAEPHHYTPLLQAIREQNPNLPVIVVSPHPEVSDWLNALDAGASDYCAPPFEPTWIQWLLAAALGPSRAAV